MPKTILIQDPDVLISLDLAQTVMEAWPDASVILCREARHILALLSDGQEPDMLIMRQSMRGALAAGLDRLVGNPRINVLLTEADHDEEHSIAEAGWRALDMPFSALQVREALRDVCPEPDPRAESHCTSIGLG
ncbi:hypothetical protein [Pseudotabrizicola alkalilacus]|uniref:Response regulatory domain-containing protein n=1 Tax=Pseudotabrizicola alkalilacus TaxID=2305252 RepID=A0A411Z1T9_9RHOB|nr:hypothetical protein [Pseudotabrizicola alkalilacus]RGP37028.1 hypothetical protein D1012_12845 [Pseudotabrizicola alkalilacus]